MFFFFSSRRRHTRSLCDWSSDVCLPISRTDGRVKASGQLGTMQTGPVATARLRRELATACPVAGGIPEPLRSEERRVGKECRSRWEADRKKRKRMSEARGRGGRWTSYHT